MKIKNFDRLAKSDGRKAALTIAEAGLEAVDTEKVVRSLVRLDGSHLFVKNEVFLLKNVKRIFVIGVGKCALEAGRALEAVLGERLNGGIVVDIRAGKLKKLKVFQGTHPLPTEINMEATKEIVALLEKCGEGDFVIFVVSGGGSTLLCKPTKLTYQEEARVFRHLSAAGANIQEVNTLRKHISLARGGNLAKYAHPAKSAALIFSDAPGDPLDVVASGPTVKDTTTAYDAEEVARKYELAKQCGFSIEVIIETPKDDKYFDNVKNILTVSNSTALDAMAGKARELGFSPLVVTTTLAGEAREAGKRVIKGLLARPAKTVLLYGGETTVKVRNSDGKGGRNQELALSAARYLEARQIILAVASDGRDNSDHGGAICDNATREKIVELGLDPQEFLDTNNSYEFFEKTRDYLDLGDTGSNVSDLIIALKE